MTIRFLCPLGHKLAVPDEIAGKKGRCPVCQQRVYIPRLTPGEQLPPGDDASPPDATTVTDVEDHLPRPTEGAHSEIAPAVASDPPPSEVGPPKSSPPPLPSNHEAPPHEAPPSGPPQSSPVAEFPDLPPPAQEFPEAQVATDEEPEGYQADSGKVQTVYLLAVALGAMTAFAAAPALKHVNLVYAPDWARLVLLLSVLQLVYICWMVSLPDWSTVWIGMVVFAIVAAVYGVGWAAITFTPDHMAVNFLDLDEPAENPIRDKAGAWCIVMLMLGSLLTYACGRISGTWRKQYELAKAARGQH